MNNNTIKYPAEDLYFLNNINGIGTKTMFQLVELLQQMHCENIWEDLDLDSLGDMIKPKAFANLKSDYGKGRAYHYEQYERLIRSGYSYIPYYSDSYPDKMKELVDAPFSLYVKGKMPDPNIPTVAIIGARQCSEYGKQVATHFGKELGYAGVQVISGMARGVDGYSQKGALQAGGTAFAVLGCGVNVCYPAENKDIYLEIPRKGGIISEYSMGTKPESRLFPARNRIISGFADLVLVVEARRRSGTYITVTQALEQGREVYAVPGRITDELSNGCNNLIKEGAGMATCVNDLIEAINYYWKDGWGALGAKENLNTEEEDASLGLHDDNQEKFGEEYLLTFMDMTPVSVDELLERTGNKFTLQELTLMLIKLQISGKVDSIGNFYYRI